MWKRWPGISAGATSRAAMRRASGALRSKVISDGCRSRRQAGPGERLLLDRVERRSGRELGPPRLGLHADELAVVRGVELLRRIPARHIHVAQAGGGAHRAVQAGPA